MKKILILVIAMVMLFMVNSYASDVNKNKSNVTSSKKITTNNKHTKKTAKKRKTTVKNTKKPKSITKTNTVKTVDVYTVYVYHEQVLPKSKNAVKVFSPKADDYAKINQKFIKPLDESIMNSAGRGNYAPVSNQVRIEVGGVTNHINGEVDDVNIGSELD